MKRFFEEHTSVVIICIVISILLCIVGSIKGMNSSGGSVDGNGLLKIVGDNLTDTIDTYQKQVIPNENLLDVEDVLKNHVILNMTSKGGPEYIGFDITKYAVPYATTSQKLSFSADVKLSKPGTLYFYSLGRYYINNAKRKIYTIKDTKWHHVKIEGSLIRYYSAELNGEVCYLSFYCIYGTGIVPTVKNLKAELGPKATPYTE